MQKFWYHSPVRFYRTLEELEDMTNPQNTQYFGHVNTPYPLELNSYHRFLIPNFNNEIGNQDLELWMVGDSDVQIPCEFGFNGDKLFRITIFSDFSFVGRFEIRGDLGTYYYSNCVEFLDSTDDSGRKYIKIATKHYYNRNLFAFDNSNFDWIVTNLPAYCFGVFEVDEDISTGKGGRSGSTVIKDAWHEEMVSYDVEVHGDNNILSFISIHSTNNDFYIDGTKRIRKEKPEIEQFSPNVIMKFSNVKDENGLNILLDEDFILSDAFKYALSNGEKTAIYTYNDNENAIPTK